MGHYDFVSAFVNVFIYFMGENKKKSLLTLLRSLANLKKEERQKCRKEEY